MADANPLAKYSNLTSLKGKVVMVTGASSGIGEACAWRFAAEGARVIVGLCLCLGHADLGPVERKGIINVHAHVTIFRTVLTALCECLACRGLHACALAIGAHGCAVLRPTQPMHGFVLV